MNFKQWLNESDSNQLTFKVYETPDLVEISYTGQEAKGYLHAQKDLENPNIFRVVRVTVNPAGKGYGKKLYLKALDVVTQKKAMLAPAKNSTSDLALNIWRSLYLSSNIKKIPLKASDWPLGSRNDFMLKKHPNLRYSDPNTYPPKNEVEFWVINSGYQS